MTFHNAENGYCVLRVKAKGRRGVVTVVGRCAAPNEGEQIAARGEWHDDEQYGTQFRAEEITTSEPGTLAGIERYLGSGLVEGIGPTYAKKLVEKFGAEVFDVIDNRSKQLEEVEGIGPKRRREIKESWAKQKTVRQIMVFLHRHGIGTARALRIYKAYGEGAIARLQSDPYRLARDLHGVGFRTADAIAAKLGLDPGAAQRLRAGIEHVLHEAVGRGHCALPEAELVEGAVELLDGDADAARVGAELGELIAAGRAVRDGELIYPPPLHAAEVEVAERLTALAARPAAHPPVDFPRALAWCEKKMGHPLAPGQADAVRAALGERVLVITGGPGVGKTTILNALLLVLRAKNVAAVLCAPTGRAARRMSESTGGLPATTIHRLLESKGGGGFARDAENPLEGELFVADEASMIDLPLMAALLRALPESAHLVLVGDVDQLPSVGPGAVLGDVIASGAVPVVRLTEIFRQAARSRIVQAAHAINAGQLPEGGDWTSPLGTDFNGRDVLSRVIYGARVSVIVGLTGTAVAGAIGIAMGVLSGYFGGKIDAVIMRIVDAWLAIPTLVLAILLSILLQPSMWNIVLILGVVYWTRYARILRSEVLTLRERDFVKLSEVAGAGGWRIITRHIVPNILNTWLVLASLTIGVVIVAEASLSFLGVGVTPPAAIVGVHAGRQPLPSFLTGRWWLLAAPGACIALTVLACNLFGDWLRVKLDPQQRNL